MEKDPIKFTSQQQWEVVNNYREITSNTPEQLWENAVSYFQWCKDNPIEIKKTAMTGKDVGKKFIVELPIMYTIKGLCLHCNILEEYLKDMRAARETAPDWYMVVSKILYLIHDQNMTYAALDLFNPLLVSRLNNIEKDDSPPSNIIVEHVYGLPELSSSENEVLQKLESENKLFPKDEK